MIVVRERGTSRRKKKGSEKGSRGGASLANSLLCAERTPGKWERKKVGDKRIKKKRLVSPNGRKGLPKREKEVRGGWRAGEGERLEGCTEEEMGGEEVWRGEGV